MRPRLKLPNGNYWRYSNMASKWISAQDLKVGDNISIEYGDYGNWVICTVINISDELFLCKYYCIEAVAHGLSIEFCIKPNETIRKNILVESA